LSDPDWEAFDTLDSEIQSRIRNLPKRWSTLRIQKGFLFLHAARLPHEMSLHAVMIQRQHSHGA